MADSQTTPKAAEEERAKSKNVRALRALVPFMAPYKLLLSAALAALVLTAALSLVLPLAVRRVVDEFQTGAVDILDSYFFAALIVALLIATGTGLRYYLVTRLGERVVADIRISVFNRMITMSPAFFERILTGEVLSRITTDTTLLLSVIGSSISWALRNTLMLMGSMALMVWTSPKLSGLVLLTVPLVILPVIILGRRVRRLSKDNQDWIAESSGKASEALLSAQTVQAFTHEAQTAKLFAEVTETSFASAKARITMRAFLTVIVISLVFAGIVGVLWIGARDVRTEAMTIGELIQFLIYAVILAGSVGALSEVWGEVQRAAGATERLVELLSIEDSVEDPVAPVALSSAGAAQVAFNNVTFRYPARPETKSLDAFSLKINPGETVAFVGPSGAGKSTVIQLLQRFYDPQEGSITLGDVPLTEMTRADFRQNIALVPQDPVIFAASARENIRFGRPEASNAEVEAAAKAAAADEFLSVLPQGYDTYVGERGVMLSGGQKQRIAIARAILRDAPILLLDEATSALDAESERLVQEAVQALSENRTTLVVAHRLATVKEADRIVVMEAGRIIAQGTHESLIAEDGLYAKLARLQFTQS